MEEFDTQMAAFKLKEDEIRTIEEIIKPFIEHDTIKEAFDGTMSKLTPLIDRILGTDELINQIVYRLYGLTEEEIKVVEGDG